MTKGERLIWRLFEMIRELMPPTAANTARFTEWAADFHAMEHPEVPPVSEDRHQAVDTADHEEIAEDPHEHGTPTRRRRK